MLCNLATSYGHADIILVLEEARANERRGNRKILAGTVPLAQMLMMLANCSDVNDMDKVSNMLLH